jgi:Ca2+:H+ antiporter
MGALRRGERIAVGVATAGSLLTAVLTYGHASSVLVFIVAAVTLAALATVVGQATEQLGERLGPGATGVLQSALGNLPELFVGLFALRAGLILVVQAAIVGSILGNSLLVLGLAFLAGGLRHGTQRFASQTPRMIAVLTALAVAALALPTLVATLHTPAAAHAEALSVAAAIVLLVVFALSIPTFLSGEPPEVSSPAPESRDDVWPLWLTAGLLAAAGAGAAFVSDWFVEALRPAMAALHLADAFAGLVVVALAGNAVENVVGIQLALANKPDYAISVILNSSLQVALALAPVLVLLSFVVGSAHLTLVLPPLLVAALGLTVALSTLIVYDGESTWLEGATLVGLYGIIAASFWWG